MSNLVGESLPVVKTATDENFFHIYAPQLHNLDPNIAKNILFSGTKIVRALPGRRSINTDKRTLAIAIRTGFNTVKGALFRSMMFPRPNKFKFYEDSFKFVGVLSFLGLIGFVVSLVSFIRQGVAPYYIAVRALDIITTAVPAGLPIVMSMVISFSLNRLRKRNTFCISPPRINVSGKINCVCFDKTGTLTQENLSVLGIHTVENESLSKMYSNVKDLSASVLKSEEGNMLYGMAACHSIKQLENELIGDPLDLQMFEFVDWDLREVSSPTNMTLVKPSTNQTTIDMTSGSQNESRAAELAIIRQLDFDSALRRMSAIVKDSENHITIYTKGAPETLKELCVSSSIPEDFHKVLTDYTFNGFRVIALAAKSMDISPEDAFKLERREIEAGLKFIGFVVFENQLKKETTDVIRKLHDGNIRMAMCTGDNIHTAISVAKRCEMISEDCQVYISKLERSDNKRHQVFWQNSQDETDILDPVTLKSKNARNYCLAVSGESFKWLTKFVSSEVLSRVLVKGMVFARMSPDEKNILVEKLQKMQYCVCFCGDGANDCSALKSADV